MKNKEVKLIDRVIRATSHAMNLGRKYRNILGDKSTSEELKERRRAEFHLAYRKMCWAIAEYSDFCGGKLHEREE